MLVELNLVGVRLEVPSNVPVLMLKETEGKMRELPIFIGGQKHPQFTMHWKASFPSGL